MKDRKFCCKVFKLYNEFHLSLLEHAVDKTEPKLAVILFESMSRASDKNWDWQNLELGVERKTKNLSFCMKDRTFCDDLIGDYYICLNDIQNSLVSNIILYAASVANTENNYWNYSSCRSKGKVTKYFTANLMRLIA